jgi:uncharacterized membrane protein
MLTVAALWLLTGRPAVAAAVGLGEFLVKMAAYYCHERLWNRVSFGRSQVDAGAATRRDSWTTH